jgi:hypothetical protein
LAPYALIIQLIAEGLLLTTLWAEIMKIWTVYARQKPAKSNELLVLERELVTATLEVEALMEHETSMESTGKDFATRREDLITMARAMYRRALSELRPDTDTVRRFRKAQ